MYDKPVNTVVKYSQCGFSLDYRQRDTEFWYVTPEKRCMASRFGVLVFTL